MSYMALYRKFRPDNFEDVKGQDHIVTTLKNQIKAERIGHAYLFCGTRGTGKTTVAKILAKTVNCEHPVDGNPCNECAMCKSITAGSSMNVIEIDAASNNGVDNIRQIREEVQYPPTEGRYKVYIIDEVHMLSIGAFNALLKTLEEPPAYVMFILATTEAHKIPITILSRCQRYDFRRIMADTIQARLQELMDAEGQEVEERALRYVAKAGDGAMRDALSLLDQCLAFYMGQKLTYENVLEVLGTVDTEVFRKLFRTIVMENTPGSLGELESVVMAGRELGQFVTDFTWYLRNLLLAKTSEHIEDVVDMSFENLEALKEDAELVTAGVLMRYIRIFSELSGQIRYSAQKRVLIEIALIKLTKPEMEENMDSLAARLERLEDRIASGIFLAPGADGFPPGEAFAKTDGAYADAAKAGRSEAGQSAIGQAAAAEGKPKKKAVPEEVQYVADHWDLIRKKMDPVPRFSVAHCRFAVEGENTLVLLFPGQNGTDYEKLTRSEASGYIADIIAAETGYEVKVVLRMLDETSTGQADLEEIVRSRIHMDIEEE